MFQLDPKKFRSAPGARLAYFCLSFPNILLMSLILNGERQPYIHGLNNDGVAANASPGADALAHQQNTDVGTNSNFFEIGRGTKFVAGSAIRRGFVFNTGGAGAVTAFAYEAQDGTGVATGRFVQCLNVVNGDLTNPANKWETAELALPFIAAGKYGSNPDLNSFSAAINYLLGQLANPTPPVIGGFNPTSGPPGAVVLINGNNFGATTGQVFIGNVQCVIQGWTNSQITLKLPVGAATDKFTVTTAGGSDISRDSFTVRTVIVKTAPGQISALTATPGSGQIVLQWTEPTDTGNSPLTDYEVRVRLAGGSWYTYAHSPRTVSNITVAGLTNNEAYELTVAPINAIGTGLASPAITATPVGSATVYSATEQSYTTTSADLVAACGAGTTAQPVTAKSSDGVSTDSQDAANAIAKARAKTLALQGIVCPLVTPGALLADNSVTNEKLAPDVKVGSLAAASNAYPQADRAGLKPSVEAFLVYIGAKLSDIYTRLASLDKSIGDAATQALDLVRRIAALEAKSGSGGGGTGTTKSVSINKGTPVNPDAAGNIDLTITAGGANYPAQSAATAGQYLKSSGTAGGESWGGMKRGSILRFTNGEVQDPQPYFRATTIYRIAKTPGIDTVSYAVNGAASQSLVFTSDVWNGSIQIPANALVVWSITFQQNFNEGFVELIATELTTP